MTWLTLLLAVLLVAAAITIRYLHREYRWLSRRYIDHLDDFLANERPHWSTLNRGHLSDTRRRHLIACDRYRWNRERTREAKAYWANAINPFLAAMPPERKAN